MDRTHIPIDKDMKTLRKTHSLTAALLILAALYYFLSSATLQDPQPLSPQTVPQEVQEPTYVDTPFMPKMTNETLKAELGNAAWKLFHTILARYPETPTQQERDTLTQYIYLFAKVYPCGDCARHFDQLLTKFPPQTSSRQTAAVWGCHVHNQVNERLGHPVYDCTHIIDDYDCGCGEDEAAGDLDQEHIQFELQKEGKQLG